MKKFEEMKKDNKGFSLVELIVVIAIMVVLVAVLGSTILGYVEKSKYSKDIQALDSVKTAVSTYVADPKCNYANDTEYTLMQLMSGTYNSADMDPSGVIAATLAEVFNITKDTTTGKVTAATFNASSTAFKGHTAADIKITIVNGAVSILVPVNSGEEDTFDAYIAGTKYKGQENATKAASGSGS